MGRLDIRKGWPHGRPFRRGGFFSTGQTNRVVGGLSNQVRHEVTKKTLNGLFSGPSPNVYVRWWCLSPAEVPGVPPQLQRSVHFQGCLHDLSGRQALPLPHGNVLRPQPATLVLGQLYATVPTLTVLENKY